MLRFCAEGKADAYKRFPIMNPEYEKRWQDEELNQLMRKFADF